MHRRPLLALIAFRDEMRFLPGFFPSIAPQVDGIIALDDGSSDGSREYVAAQPDVLEVLHIPAGTHGDNEDSILRRRLIEASRGSCSCGRRRCPDARPRSALRARRWPPQTSRGTAAQAELRCRLVRTGSFLHVRR
jgi:hypothetical protein